MPTKAKADRRWTATPETTQALERELGRLRQARERSLKRYYDDPVAFAHDCIEWPEGQSLTPYQEEVLAELPIQKRVAQRGPHTLGKSMSHSMAVLWFAFTRDAAGVDWKCPTTAGGWHQLEQYLWPEIHKWAARLKWDKLGRDPMKYGKELLRLNLQLTFGRAFAVASNIPARIEGAHADALMFIFDEAKIISNETFDAAEGAFASTGETLAFCSSTPGPPMGRFYDIHMQKPGLTNWWTRHVTLEEAISAGRLKRSWADDNKVLWGEDSALYANRVLGEFHADDQTSIIPTSWVEAAVLRWKDHTARSQLAPDHPTYWALPQAVDRVGVDVARSGLDKTVQAIIAGYRINELLTAHHDMTDVTAAKVEATLDQHGGATAMVDTDGVGAGVYDMLNRDGYACLPFHAGEATDMKDRSGELGFVNVKSAAWWKVREALDPAFMATMELPTHPVLLADLTAPKWSEPGKGKIKAESKDDLKKRLGRSPDFGDAVVMGMWVPRPHRKRRAVYAGRA